MSNSIDILKEVKDPETLKEIDALVDKIKQKQANSGAEFTSSQFEKRRRNILFYSFVVLCALSYLAFQYITYLFGFTLGLFIANFSLLAYEWLDEIYFEGNTIKKLAENSIALSVFFVGLIWLFVSSLEFGDRWIGGQSNLSIEEDRVKSTVQQPVYDVQPPATADTIAPPVRVELRGDKGATTYK